jgi:hypothetical protein
MILISHRGNIMGSNPKKENHPDYIQSTLNLGYDVEIDLWVIEGCYYLGHNEPLYGTTQHWLNKRKNKLWVHCKNLEAIEWFNSIGGFNYFWHHDDMTMTSKGYIWMNSKIRPIKNSIAVILENNNFILTECAGICSDNIKVYDERY